MGIVRARPVTDDAATPVDPARLLVDLGSNDPAIRRGAARLLGGHRDAVGALVDRLEIETETSVIDVLLTSIGRSGGGAAIRALLQLLRSEDVHLRNGAIETLHGIDDAEVFCEIEFLLDDADSDVRIFALNILHSLRHPSTPDLARRVIVTDAHVNVCAAAVDVLAECGSPEAVADLESLSLRFPLEPFLAFAVRVAIKRIG